MGTINAVLNTIFDGLFAVVGWMPPGLSLFLISGVVGILLLIVYAKISNQDGIRKAKDKIQCNLFLIRLYKDELGLTFKAMSKLLVFLLPYLGHQLIPLLIMIVPFFLIAGQLNARYGYSPIDPGKPAVVSVKLSKECSLEKMDLSLEAGGGVAVETRPVRIPSKHEVGFRIRVNEPGEHLLKLKVDGETIEKKVNAAPGLHRVSHVRSSGFWDLLLYPGEAAIPGDSMVESIAVTTPLATVNVLGLEWHWILWFLVFSIAVAFLLKGQFGVEI